MTKEEKQDKAADLAEAMLELTVEMKNGFITEEGFIAVAKIVIFNAMS